MLRRAFEDYTVREWITRSGVDEFVGTSSDPRLGNYVYCLQGVSGGPIKIGYTTEIRKRFHTIQTCSPMLLRVLCIVEGSKRRERELHERLGEYRLWGEWFRPVSKVFDAIEKLRAEGENGIK